MHLDNDSEKAEAAAGRERASMSSASRYARRSIARMRSRVMDALAWLPHMWDAAVGPRHIVGRRVRLRCGWRWVEAAIVDVDTGGSGLCSADGPKGSFYIVPVYATRPLPLTLASEARAIRSARQLQSDQERMGKIAAGEDV